VKTTKDTTITMVLTEEEAKYLMALCGRISGTYGPARALFSQVYTQIYDLIGEDDSYSDRVLAGCHLDVAGT